MYFDEVCEKELQELQRACKHALLAIPAVRTLDKEPLGGQETYNNTLC